MSLITVWIFAKNNVMSQSDREFEKAKTADLEDETTDIGFSETLLSKNINATNVTNLNKASGACSRTMTKKGLELRSVVKEKLRLAANKAFTEHVIAFQEFLATSRNPNQINNELF